ncbi:MAG TPA: hypothetical protein VIE13_14130 [Terriglobales bacterium]|jgi:predicted DNA binding CopG/RHH family protein
MAKMKKREGAGNFHTTRLEVPAFHSEAEEAKWWDTHTKEVDDLIRRAEAAGAVTHGEVALALASPTRITTIRLPEVTIAKARGLAARKGLRYQTYLKMLIHEGINREDQAG